MLRVGLCKVTVPETDSLQISQSGMRWMENTYPDRARGWVGFNVPMSHKITAAADILLMPSRFEPCGLNQLYAMAYGTAPIAHATGGLRDTVIPFNPWDGAHMAPPAMHHAHVRNEPCRIVPATCTNCHCTLLGSRLSARCRCVKATLSLWDCGGRHGHRMDIHSMHQ